jgi:hypothetical protein
MKDGERLVWAAAFAVAMDKVDVASGGVSAEQAHAVAQQACVRAYAAVMVLRNLSAVVSPTQIAALSMLRDMAGESN